MAGTYRYLQIPTDTLQIPYIWYVPIFCTASVVRLQTSKPKTDGMCHSCMAIKFNIDINIVVVIDCNSPLFANTYNGGGRRGGGEGRGKCQSGRKENIQRSSPFSFTKQSMTHEHDTSSCIRLSYDGLESERPRTLSNAFLDAYKTQP